MEVLESFPVVAENLEVLDQKWYARFEALAAFQAHEFFEDKKQVREAAKKSFLSNKDQNPELSYPDIDLQELDEKEKQLKALKKEIFDEENNQVVKIAYQWKINEKIAEIRLLKNAVPQIGGAVNEAIESGVSREKRMRRFQKYAEFIYGNPSPQIMAHTLEESAAEIEKAKASGNQALILAAQKLEASLPKTPVLAEAESLPELPQAALVEKVAGYTRERLKALMGKSSDGEAEGAYNQVFQDSKQGVKYSSETVQGIFQAVLEELEADGWRAVVNTKSGSTIFSIDQGEKIAKIPNKEASAQRVMELVAHEIGVHLQRRLNGEKSKLQLLGLGLDRYIRGDEGFASALEDSIKRKITNPETGKLKAYFGLDRHLAISLAVGTDGEPRDFKVVFGIMENYYYFQQILAGKKEDEAKETAENMAWNICVRVFRGTDCKTPGVCFTKDMLYTEGNIDMWRFIGQRHEDRFVVEMGQLESGKYDAANARHLWVMMRLGILEGDLLSEDELQEMDQRFKK